jgi:hypothetical protein
MSQLKSTHVQVAEQMGVDSGHRVLMLMYSLAPLNRKHTKAGGHVVGGVVSACWIGRRKAQGFEFYDEVSKLCQRR